MVTSVDELSLDVQFELVGNLGVTSMLAKSQERSRTPEKFDLTTDQFYTSQ
jgi:hypothetical protein